jgi:hypothetical protein
MKKAPIGSSHNAGKKRNPSAGSASALHSAGKTKPTFEEARMAKLERQAPKGKAS